MRYTIDIMKYTASAFALIALIPNLAHAQSFQLVFTNFLKFTNSTLIPFILGIGFLFLVINIFRFFILEGDSEDGREKAKNLALYGVLAFVVIILFWGIINLLSTSIGLQGKAMPGFDYQTANP
jgi:uncharacterized membrane protein YidH (DUF202 family)